MGSVFAERPPVARAFPTPHRLLSPNPTKCICGRLKVHFGAVAGRTCWISVPTRFYSYHFGLVSNRFRFLFSTLVVYWDGIIIHIIGTFDISTNSILPCRLADRLDYILHYQRKTIALSRYISTWSRRRICWTGGRTRRRPLDQDLVTHCRVKVRQKRNGKPVGREVRFYKLFIIRYLYI